MNRYRLAPLALAVLSLFVSGCGKGAYEERLSKSLAEMNFNARFAPLSLNLESFGNWPIQVRVPEKVLAVPKSGPATLKRFASEGVSPQEHMPPFVSLPNVARCVQNSAPPEQGNNGTPVTVYLGAVAIADPKDDAWKTAMRDQIRAASPELADADWKEEKVVGTDHKEVKYQVIRASGKGSFTRRGAVEPRVFDNIKVDVYVVERDGWRVFIALCAPTHANTADFVPSTLGPLMVGTLKVNAPAPTPEPAATAPVAPAGQKAPAAQTPAKN